MSRYLLSKHKDLYLLSERFCQDPLENYFGKQRQCGGHNENPTVKQCIDNAANNYKSTRIFRTEANKKKLQEEISNR